MLACIPSGLVRNNCRSPEKVRADVLLPVSCGDVMRYRHRINISGHLRNVEDVPDRL